MDDYILTQIERYLVDELPNPCNYLYLPEMIFKEMSYARETAIIIMDRITDHPFKDPRDILWQFQMEIEHCCRIATSGDALFIFYIMRDTAEEIARLIA